MKHRNIPEYLKWLYLSLLLPDDGSVLPCVSVCDLFGCVSKQHNNNNDDVVIGAGEQTSNYNSGNGFIWIRLTSEWLQRKTL